jgi:hypothetical protein
MSGGVVEEVEKNEAKNVATTSTALVANHFSCRRSSPTDPLNRTTIATRDAPSAATRGRTNNNPSRFPPEDCLKGCCHAAVAKMRMNAVTSANAPAMNRATGRHRGVRR